MLDPAIARWNGIDASAESYIHCSPYAYVDNNPANNTDPDGNTTVYGAYGMQAAAGRINKYYESGMQSAAYEQAYHSRGLMTPFEQNQMFYGSYWNDQMNVWRRLAGGPSSIGGSYSVSGVSFDGFATLSGKVFGSILKATPFVGPLMGAIGAARSGDVGGFALNMGFAATDIGVLGSFGGSGVRASAGAAADRSIAGLSNAELVQEVANRAEAAVGGSGRFAGTSKHAYANQLLTRYQRLYGDRGLETEVSYHLGIERTYGYPGSSRADVWYAATGTIYDYKFGAGTMSGYQSQNYFTNFINLNTINIVYPTVPTSYTPYGNYSIPTVTIPTFTFPH